MANPRHKHATLVADTDTSITLDGRGLIVVINHDTAANHELYCTIGATISALAADDTMAVLPGFRRVIGQADGDGTTVVHVRGVAASHISVELIAYGEDDFV